MRRIAQLFFEETGNIMLPVLVLMSFLGVGARTLFPGYYGLGKFTIGIGDFGGLLGLVAFMSILELVSLPKVIRESRNRTEKWKYRLFGFLVDGVAVLVGGGIGLLVFK